MLIVDELRVANWQRTKDGSKNRNRPDRISPLAEDKAPTIGGTDIPQDQVIAWLKAIGPSADDAVDMAPAASNAAESELTRAADTWGVSK